MTVPPTNVAGTGTGNPASANAAGAPAARIILVPNAAAVKSILKIDVGGASPITVNSKGSVSPIDPLLLVNPPGGGLDGPTPAAVPANGTGSPDIPPPRSVPADLPSPCADPQSLHR